MTSENMMTELRRIVGAYVQQRKCAVTVAAMESALKSHSAEKSAAYARGKADAFRSVLDELCMTFDIDPWADEHERQM